MEDSNSSDGDNSEDDVPIKRYKHTQILSPDSPEDIDLSMMVETEYNDDATSDDTESSIDEPVIINRDNSAQLPQIEGYCNPITVVNIKEEPLYEDNSNDDDDDDDNNISFNQTDLSVKKDITETTLEKKSKKKKTLSDMEIADLNVKFLYICQMCQESFSNVDQLSKHLVTHEQRGTFLCQTCRRVYQNIKDLRNHMICHVQVGKYKCEECNRSYHHTQSLMSHRRKFHQGKKSHYCRVCNKSYVEKSDLVCHMRTHADTKLKCQYCDKAFQTERYLKNHTMHTHLGLQHATVQCKICHVTCQKRNLRNHYKTHQDKVHKCEHCGKCLTTSYSLKVHVRRHNGVKPFSCDICQQTFFDKSKLNRHILSHSADKNFQCDICEKSFKHSQNLRQHKLSHHTDKEYPCRICGAMFKCISSVWSHLRKHTHENRFKCEFCEKSFYRADHLRSHLTKHTGVKAFQCEMCSKKFAKSHDLTEHKRLHSGERPYHCKTCNKYFTRNGEFKRHNRSKFHLEKERDICNDPQEPIVSLDILP